MRTVVSVNVAGIRCGPRAFADGTRARVWEAAGVAGAGAGAGALALARATRRASSSLARVAAMRASSAVSYKQVISVIYYWRIG